VADRKDAKGGTSAKRIKLTDIIPVNLSVPDLHIALQIWVMWNSRIDQMGFVPVHRVEDFSLLALLRSAGYSTEALGVGANGGPMTEKDVQACVRKLGGYNTRQHAGSRISWHDLFAVNASLASRAMAMAGRYGYRYWTGDVDKDILVFPPAHVEAGDNTDKESSLTQEESSTRPSRNLAVSFGAKKSTYKFNVCKYGIVRKSFSRLQKRGDTIPPG
jgi:hypothetical protein